MKSSHDYYVYIVECRDWSYYVGITNDLERRLWEHNTGFDPGCYTFERRPVESKYFEHFTDVNQGISRETIKRMVTERNRLCFVKIGMNLNGYLNLRPVNQTPAMLRQAQHDSLNALQASQNNNNDNSNEIQIRSH